MNMFMFSAVPIFMGIIFIIIIVTLISRAAKFGADKSKPIMPIRSKVISKRTHVWGNILIQAIMLRLNSKTGNAWSLAYRMIK